MYNSINSVSDSTKSVNTTTQHAGNDILFNAPILTENGVWYTEYQNEDDFDKPSAEIRYKLSDPITNDTGEGEIKNKLYSFIKDAIKINN